MLMAYSSIWAFDLVLDDFIGVPLDLFNAEAVEKTIDLSLEEKIFFQEGDDFEESLPLERTENNLKVSEVFVIDKIDSQWRTSLKVLVPGASMNDLTKKGVFVDYGLFFHELLQIEHYPSKVTIVDNMATITPIFPKG
jgi:hypothetical protein